MELPYIEDKTFEKIDFRENYLEKGEYESCMFKNCDFSNTDFLNMKFSDCQFIGCNLSLVKLTMVILNDVKFKDSKLLGLHFDTCNSFGFSVSFDGCVLNHSSFFKRKLKKIIFRNSQLHEVDFSNCDLSESLFDSCDLLRATFNSTNLEKVDFRTSYNYSISPEINRIKKAKFAMPGVLGLLDKYDIEIED